MDFGRVKKGEGKSGMSTEKELLDLVEVFLAKLRVRPNIHHKEF